MAFHNLVVWFDYFCTVYGFFGSPRPRLVSEFLLVWEALLVQLFLIRHTHAIRAPKSLLDAKICLGVILYFYFTLSRTSLPW